MKSARTLRTMRRAGLSPAVVFFAGFTPSGKRVHTIARTHRAVERLLAALPAQMVRVFFAIGITPLQSVRLGSRYLASPPDVRAAWFQSALTAPGFHAL